MKMRLIFLLSSLISIVTVGQFHGTYSELRNQATEGASRAVIWSESFSNGFGSDWTYEAVGGIANWEFRGVTTNPNVQTGNRGACAIAGEEGHINSPTWEDGFVIFDSFWWDNPLLPCSENNIGSGPAPGPHLAILTSPVINLSAYPNIALQFNQFFRDYDTHTFIEVSTNGVDWSMVFDNDQNPDAALRTDQVIIPISNPAGGQSQVQFRFVFDGLGYCWQLDDIKINEINADDLQLSNATYGAFDISAPDNLTGYEWMQYTKYPDELAPLLRLSAEVKNIGSNAQSDVRLGVRIKKISNQSIVLNSISETGMSLQPGILDTIVTEDFQMPPTKGKYEIRFSAEQNESDNSILDNRDTSYFSITDAVYAKDQSFTNAVYVPSNSLAQLPYEIGNIFYMPIDGQVCYSISAAVAAGTSTPGSIYGALYEFNFDENPTATLIAVTTSLEVDGSMINTYSMSNFTTLTFDQPILLSAGKAYFAVVGTPDGGEQVVFAMSGVSPKLTSWVKYNTGQYFYLNRIPMVRMNFSSTIEPEVDQEFIEPAYIYPNPSNATIVVSLNSYLGLKVNLRVTNSLGQLLWESSIEKLEEPLQQLDILFPAPGVYHLRIQSEEEEKVYRIVRQ